MDASGGVLGEQRGVGDDDAGLELAAQPVDEAPVGVGHRHHEAAAVQVEHRALRLAVARGDDGDGAAFDGVVADLELLPRLFRRPGRPALAVAGDGAFDVGDVEHPLEADHPQDALQHAALPTGHARACGLAVET